MCLRLRVGNTARVVVPGNLDRLRTGGALWLSRANPLRPSKRSLSFSGSDGPPPTKQLDGVTFRHDDSVDAS